MTQNPTVTVGIRTWSLPLCGQSAGCHRPGREGRWGQAGQLVHHRWRLLIGAHKVQPGHNCATCLWRSGAGSGRSEMTDDGTVWHQTRQNPCWSFFKKVLFITLLLYIFTILSLRSVSVFSLTSFLSRRSSQSSVGECSGLGSPALGELATFLFTSRPGAMGEGLLSVWRRCVAPAATCRPPSSSASPSTHRRLATEQGEVKERLDLFSRSLRAELSLGWRCGWEVSSCYITCGWFRHVSSTVIETRLDCHTGTASTWTHLLLPAFAGARRCWLTRGGTRRHVWRDCLGSARHR